MSVRTTFDEKRDEAKEHISKAIDALKICLDDSTWGFSDMSKDYIDVMIKQYLKLVKIRHKL